MCFELLQIGPYHEVGFPPPKPLKEAKRLLGPTCIYPQVHATVDAESQNNTAVVVSV